MNYLIPLGIAAIFCALPFIMAKHQPEPAMWPWGRIFWIALPVCVGWTFLVPLMDWPQSIALPAIAAIWYIVGRKEQQRSFAEYCIKEVRKAARDMHQ